MVEISEKNKMKKVITDYIEFYIRWKKMMNETDVCVAFEDSIELARTAGVPESKIIHNVDEIDKLFM